jgi:hypothetical protein
VNLQNAPCNNKNKNKKYTNSVPNSKKRVMVSTTKNKKLMQYTKIIFADFEKHTRHIHKLHEKISVFLMQNRRCTKLPLRVKRLVTYLREENRLNVTENKQFVVSGKETHRDIKHRLTLQFID